MSNEQRDPLCLVACDGARALGTSIAGALGVSLVDSEDVWFSCGEGKHVLQEKVRARDVYVLQTCVRPSHERSVYEAFLMALHAVDACRCADAARVTLVLPYLPGGRQDKRKHHVREGVSTGLFARMIQAAGASMLVTVEPHNEAMIGCFEPARCVFEPVSVHTPYAEYLRGLGVHPDVVASTDVGGLESARNYAQHLRADLVACSKRRDYRVASVVAETEVIGDVAGRSVLLVDDIVDTAGSAVSAVRALWAAGAGDVCIAAVHPLLSGPAWERLAELERDARARGTAFRMLGSSTVLHADPPAWYHTFALEPLLANVIASINQRRSVRALE